MNLAGQKVLVIGLGKTGIASSRFLIGQGAKVFVTDEKPLTDLKSAIIEIGGPSEKLEFCKYDPDILARIDLIIPSPGVPPSNILLIEAVHKKIPIVSEIELACRFLKPPMIAITGTNGKTTTTTLIGNILAKEGKRVFVGGNIGNPLIGYIDGKQEDEFAVVEVSSFQLQWIQYFHPSVAILLNTTCDHVDYHGSFDAYRSVKERLFENQGESDLAILNADDPRSWELSNNMLAKVEFFSTSSHGTAGMHLAGKVLVHHTIENEKEEYSLDMIKIPGLHNIENIMAAIMAARYCGCSRESIIRAVTEFKGIAHRIEFTDEKNGVTFYDDSKGTNVGAVVRALETFSRPIILLLGGRDKEGDFGTLSALVSAKVKELVLFGEARNTIGDLMGDIVKTTKAATLKEAIEIAYRHSSPGDVVLLSPGCASFDEFSNYKERGRFFKDVVKNL
ncbi:MAG TPA: UDP-N-acetylmuramoyl-L-alanine--D-glutamate ligase [Syntrophaceae bacterium]|jgi:UDP-N-acetylmuramoylalanine--D-glutamate ligase|nr:UDP-N-acetylmuramoyl-L-alanine--D-glutamate ligase [Syntrophaceae bacterium]